MRRITDKSRSLVALATVLGVASLAAAMPVVAAASNAGP
jgi:hypothetical protein